MATSTKDQIEQDEIRLLFELARDAKGNIDVVAKRCKISRQKAWRIIKKLESTKTILGYSAVFDEQKVGLQHFVLLLKRTNAKLDEKAIDAATLKEADDICAEFGITLENSAYTHGEYDWVASFAAKDIKQAKLLSRKLVALYPHLVQRVIILQTLSFVRKNYMLNPDAAKLKELLL